jgi:hypothetical protein
MERLLIEQRLRHRDMRQRNVAGGDAAQNELDRLRGDIERPLSPTTLKQAFSITGSDGEHLVAVNLMAMGNFPCDEN